MEFSRKPFLLILFLLLVASLSLTARAEMGGRADPRRSNLIRIDRTGISPWMAEVKQGEALTWMNSSSVSAQVGFDPNRGQQVACAHEQQESSQAGQVLLPIGSSATCTLEAGTYTYTVYRQIAHRAGGVEVRRSRGVILVGE